MGWFLTLAEPRWSAGNFYCYHKMRVCWTGQNLSLATGFLWQAKIIVAMVLMCTEKIVLSQHKSSGNYLQVINAAQPNGLYWSILFIARNGKFRVPWLYIPTNLCSDNLAWHMIAQLSMYTTTRRRLIRLLQRQYALLFFLNFYTY